MVKTQVNYCMP